MTVTKLENYRAAASRARLQGHPVLARAIERIVRAELVRLARLSN